MEKKKKNRWKGTEDQARLYCSSSCLMGDFMCVIFKQRCKEIACLVTKAKSSSRMAVERESLSKEWWMYLEAQSPALTPGISSAILVCATCAILVQWRAYCLPVNGMHAKLV